MNDRNKQVKDFLISLYVPGYSFEKHRFLVRWLNGGVKLRPIDPKGDGNRARLDILIIDTVGKGVARSFKGYRILKADFAHIGKKFADCYIYENGELGTPCRIDITSAKYSIIIQ